jgi:hypothetical protein
MLSGSLSLRHDASSGCGGEDGLQKWRIEADILKKKYQTADRVSCIEPSVFWRVY